MWWATGLQAEKTSCSTGTDVLAARLIEADDAFSHKANLS